MAALRQTVEGQMASPTAKKSSSQLFSEPAPSPVHLRLATLYKGGSNSLLQGGGQQAGYFFSLVSSGQILPWPAITGGSAKIFYDAQSEGRHLNRLAGL